VPTLGTVSARILTRVTLAATLALVTLGGYTRGSGSGYGCRDRWPLCEDGLLGGLLPRADFHMIVEWSHRWLAAVVGILAVLTAYAAWRSARRWVAAMAISAVLVIAAQAWVGRLIVTSDLDADLVTLHLFISMTIAGLLTLAMVATTPAARTRTSGGWTSALGIGAVGALALLMAGSYAHNLYVPGWPLVGGEVVPDLSNRYVALHWLHRMLAAAMLVYLGYLVVAARRRARPRAERRLLWAVLGAHAVNIGLGAAHVFTMVGSSALVAAHLLMAALVWSGLVAATAMAAGAGVDEPGSLGAR
jgi:heme A synthase